MKTLPSAAALAMLVFGLSVSAATALPPDPIPGTTTQCGAPIRSTLKTAGGNTLNNVQFARVPFAAAVVTVPAGQTQCIKATFSAIASCTGTTGAACHLRALDNAVEMDPNLGIADLTAFTGSATDAFAPHSFEWVIRVGPGQHVIAIQSKVNAATTNLKLFGWTLDVEVLK